MRAIAFLPLVLGVVVGFGAPPLVHGVRAWLYPTPEQVAAAQKAEAERRARQIEEMRRDAEQRAAGVNGNLAARHPGCTFDDLGGYTTPDLVHHPIFAIFCPAQNVAVDTTREEKRSEGKVTHTYEIPETTSTAEQPQ